MTDDLPDAVEQIFKDGASAGWKTITGNCPKCGQWCIATIPKKYRVWCINCGVCNGVVSWFEPGWPGSNITSHPSGRRG